MDKSENLEPSNKNGTKLSKQPVVCRYFLYWQTLDNNGHRYPGNYDNLDKVTGLSSNDRIRKLNRSGQVNFHNMKRFANEVLK